MSDLKSSFQRTLEHLKTDLLSLRTGRAHPGLIEQIAVTAYNSTLPLVQLASIAAPNPKTLVVQPWDKAMLKDIERALVEADLGMMPVNDGTVLRLAIPTLTEERRHQYLKLLGQKLEQARVAIRKTREEELRTLREGKTAGTLSENEFFARQKNLQKDVDAWVEEISQLGRKKEQDIMTV